MEGGGAAAVAVSGGGTAAMSRGVVCERRCCCCDKQRARVVMRWGAGVMAWHFSERCSAAAVVVTRSGGVTAASLGVSATVSGGA